MLLVDMPKSSIEKISAHTWKATCGECSAWHASASYFGAVLWLEQHYSQPILKPRHGSSD